MSAQISRSPETETAAAVSDGDLAPSLPSENTLALGSLQVGAHLVVRCLKDWRVATVVAIGADRITLSVGSPSGRTYRIRRPPDSVLTLDGTIPILGAGAWRAGLARYDARW